MRFLKISSIILLISLLTLGITGFILHKNGYFADPAIALRELKKIGKEAHTTEVHKAASTGDIGLLRLLSRAQADFATPDATERTPLHHALQGGHHHLLPILEAEQCDLDARDADGHTPLSILLAKEEITTAASLIEKGASPDFTLPNGELALPGYYHQERLDLVNFLLAHGASPDSPARDGQPLLSLALRDNQPQLAKTLLEKGAKADILIDGEPALAALLQNAERWKIDSSTLATLCGNLLLSGAPAEAALSTGSRPLQLALAKDLRPLLDLLLPRCQNVTDTLWLAIQNDNNEAVRILLEKGAPTEELSTTRDTPLTHAIRHNNVALLNTLLTHKANPNQHCPEGQPALFLAIALAHNDCALAMLNHENHPELNAFMTSPVSEEFIELFGGKKAGQFYWYCHNETGLTPLMAAVMLKNLELAEHLIALGVDKFQGTASPGVVYPIQMAATNTDIKMQQLLLGVSYREEDQARKFVIDLSDQKVTYYKNGELTRTATVSTGRPGYRTPPGEYVITDKTRHKKSNIYNEAPMPYFQRFSCGAIGFHEGYVGSRYASHGCIRLPRATAQFFWSETSIGDRVTIRD